MFSKQRNRRFIRRGPSSVAVPGRKLLNTRSGDRLAALQSFQRKSSPRAFDLEHYSEADLMGSNPNYNDLSPIRPNPFHTIAESVPLLSPKKQPSHSVLLNELEEEDVDAETDGLPEARARSSNSAFLAVGDCSCRWCTC